MSEQEGQGVPGQGGDIPVSPVTGGDAADEPPRQAPPTVRGSLRERIESRRESRLKLVPVPDLEEIGVLFRPIGDGTRQRIAKMAQKSGKSYGDPNQDASVLADACVGVFEQVGGQWVSVDPDNRDDAWLSSDDGSIKVQGQPLTFASHRLQELLGTEDQPTRECVKALFVTEGDMMSVTRAIFEFSGYTEDLVDEEIAGN